MKAIIELYCYYYLFIYCGCKDNTRAKGKWMIKIRKLESEAEVTRASVKGKAEKQDPRTGNLGITQTLNLVYSYYWWEILYCRILK